MGKEAKAAIGISGREFLPAGCHNPCPRHGSPRDLVHDKSNDAGLFWGAGDVDTSHSELGLGGAKAADVTASVKNEAATWSILPDRQS